MHSNMITSLVSTVSLLLVSQSVQAGSFFSFNFSFDSHGGYYTPYRYVYQPAYFHGWPYYYGHTHVYPVTYVYYPSVFYRTVYPYRYPYYAYHPYWHNYRPYYHHYKHHGYQSQIQSSTHVYGYAQPRRTYYYPSKEYYREQQYRDEHYNRYDKRRYDHYKPGQTEQQAANERATRNLMERHRAELQLKNRDNKFDNTRPDLKTVAPRQSEIRRSEINSRQITFNESPNGTNVRDDQRKTGKNVEKRRQLQQHNANAIHAIQNQPSDFKSRNQNSEPANNSNAFNQARQSLPQWQQRGTSGIGKTASDNRSRKKESRSFSSGISARNNNAVSMQNSFRSRPGFSSFRD